VLLALLIAAPAFAQIQSAAQAPAAALPGDAQLRLTVVDQTAAGIPTATVTLTPPVGQPITATTDEHGVATVPSIPVGAVKAHVEFVGFQTVDTVLNIRRGANAATVTMALAGLAQEVTVNADNEPVGGDQHGAAMVTTLTKEEIDALPEDPEDLQAYLEQLAGPDGATFFLNGFRGGRLPTKDEIRTIRIRQNNFAADGHESGGRAGIEIVTRPSTESFNGNLNMGYQSDALNARNAQALTETPEGTKQVQFQFRGPVVRGKSAFSATVSGNNRFTSNNNLSLDEFGNRIGTQVRIPTDQRNANLGFEDAVTKNSTLRLNYQRQSQDGHNQGLGTFDYPDERARETSSDTNMFRAQLQGVVGKSSLNEVRFQFYRTDSETTSVSDAPTIIVQDAFSRGGAGANSKNRSSTIELADNFDFTPHRNHQMRVGALLEGGNYNMFDQTNANGRYTYASLDDYLAGRLLQYSIRTGTLDTSFNQYQLGLYVQDDIKVNNKISLGLGLRNEMQSHIDRIWNVMPRVGASYAMTSKTSIRGGYGIYYDWYDSSIYDQTLRLSGLPGSQQDHQFNYFYTVDDAGNYIQHEIDGLAGATNKTVAAPDLKMPYVQQTSVGVQQQLFPNVNLQVTYLRQDGRDQLRGIDINTPVVDPLTGIVARPDPDSGIVTQIQSTGHSISNRLTFQTRYQLPNQRGMLQVSYQLGKAMSDYSGATSLPSDSLHPELDWGPAGSDIRHQAQIGGMWRLPKDFRVQGNLQIRSGVAYNETTGLDDNHDGVINDRPFGVTRNSLRGSGYWNVTQFTINKSFGFGGQRANANAQNGNQNGQNRGANGNGNGNFNPNFQGGNFQGGGGGFQGNRGGGGRGDFGNASNQRYSVQFSLRANNPLNRVIETGYTGNERSPFFLLPTTVQTARRVEFETSFRF
jgi:hypothetical protein